MRPHLENAGYGLLDYAAYPVTMLAIAPTLLRHLGTSGYGILAFSMAAVNTGAIIASGFGDANIQQIAVARAAGETRIIRETVRSTVGIHLALGTTLAILGIVLAPRIASKVTSSEPSTLHPCTQVLLISSALVLVRTMETVAVSTQRAFQSYADAVRISAAFRILALVVAAGLASARESIQRIVLAIALLSVLSTFLQLYRLGRRVSFSSLVPSFDGERIRALVAYGGFTWIQAVGGVIFSQADRLLVGMSMGTVAVGAYSLAAQLAQPIAGGTASALHFLFPHIALRNARAGIASVRYTIYRAFVCNAAIILLAATPLLLFGSSFMRIWAGTHNAALTAYAFPLLVIASAFSGLSVTGNYALLALGSVRTATWMTLLGGCLMLALAKPLTTELGIGGMAMARLASAVTSLLVYVPLWRRLSPSQQCTMPAVEILPPAEEGTLR